MKKFFSRRVVTPEGVYAATVVVERGLITAVEPGQVADSKELHEFALLPGLVDPHVHLNEPGRTEWEGFETGTAAAAAGGVTTVVDMPLNSSPVTTTLAALEGKRSAAAGKLSIDVAFYAGLVPGNASELPALVDDGVVGVKAFLCHSGIDDFPAATERDLREAMPLLAELGVPLLAHAELVSDVPAPSDPCSYADYCRTRPPSFEREAIALLIDLCRETRCRTHLVHLADAGSLPELAAARAEGLPITVETCPHYLIFAAEEIPNGATPYKCAPPIRDAANREGLWQGLDDGIIDFIASDHSPCPPELKSLDAGRFDQAWGGISSLQIGLPAIWSQANARGYDLAAVANWMSHRPAELIGISAGIQVGAPANLVVFDTDARVTVRGEDLHHRHKVTPYEGHTLQGQVVATYLRGERAAAGRGRTR